jgi:hypothetical protein
VEPHPVLSRRKRWTVLETCTCEIRNALKPVGSQHLEDLIMYTYTRNIYHCTEEINWEGVDWTNLALDRNQ